MYDEVAITEIYTLSLHDALPIYFGDLLIEVLGQPVHLVVLLVVLGPQLDLGDRLVGEAVAHHERRSEEHTSELQSPYDLVCRLLLEKKKKTLQTLLFHEL